MVQGKPSLRDDLLAYQQSSPEVAEMLGKLLEMVPTVPKDGYLSTVDLLQHVIDYIWDLQTALSTPNNVQSTIISFCEQECEKL